MSRGVSLAIRAARWAIMLGFSLMLCLSAVAANRALSAGYELNVSVAGESYKIHTLKRFVPGHTLTHRFGEYTAKLDITPRDSGRFGMRVQVLKRSEGREVTGVLMDQEFEGELGGMLEFEGANWVSAIEGAIAVEWLADQ